MKVSTLFSVLAFMGMSYAKKDSSSVSPPTYSKINSKSTPKLNPECEILKEIFKDLKVEYKWYSEINSCCNSEPLFSCDKDNKIERITLNTVKLNIPLSPKFSELKNLKKLSLSGTGVYGDIPGSIYQISNLDTLELNDNHLNGTISKDIENLKNLKVL
ncbi:hypothetical protein PIROE2DRAFT_9536 [Piromyces sp. E2]|nr:hypothetical protein PIROE2DRAFT_9536 [Piromyces sp. E2]|eukprot:OUM63866.1 hypothetical protein PIROE2DRAFT_9536 [Piromyces sp. E2]